MGHCRYVYRISGIISGLDIARSIRLSKVLEPLLMRGHMVWSTGVDKTYIFQIGDSNWSRGWHRIGSMSHDEHLAMVVIVGVSDVIGELSTCGSRLTYLLLTLFFVVADFTAISTFDWVLSAWTGTEALPSSERSYIVYVFLLKSGVIFVGQTSSASSLAESASSYSRTFSSSVQLCVEHVTFLRHLSLFEHGFLQLTTLIEDRRKREGSPLLGRRFSSCQTVVRWRLGIFAPSQHPSHWHLLSWPSHKVPCSSSRSLW